MGEARRSSSIAAAESASEPALDGRGLTPSESGPGDRDLPLGADVIGQALGRQGSQPLWWHPFAEGLRGVGDAPPLPVGVEAAGSSEPDRVVVRIDRPRTEGVQMVIGRDHGSSLLQRLSHSGGSGWDPLGNQPVHDGGGGTIRRGRAEGLHDVATVGPAVGGSGNHPGEAVLVEQGGATMGGARVGVPARRRQRWPFAATGP